jgi:C4-dicarboxylate-specific signal transduction histidine kinase
MRRDDVKPPASRPSGEALEAMGEALNAIAAFVTEQQLESLDDMTATLHDLFVGTDEKWAAYWVAEGDHRSNEFLGWGPTNRRITMHLLTVKHRNPVDGELIVHTEFDRLHAMWQMGVKAVGRPILEGR